MITSTQLTAAGYRKWPERFKQYSKFFYQKRFDYEHGKRYFIQFYEYDPLPNETEKCYSSDAQFKDSHGNTFNVECLTNDSVEQVEAFFLRVWEHQICEYYELFEE